MAEIIITIADVRFWWFKVNSEPNCSDPMTDPFLKKCTVSSFHSNCYFLGEPEKGRVLVIDPGAEPDRLITVLQETGRTPVSILATHGHIDHVGAAKALQDRYDIPFYMHEEDLYLVENLDDQARAFGVTAPPEPDVDGFISEGRLTTEANIEFDVRHTPGHSPGGVTFYSEEFEKAFVGDCVFEGSIGRSDFPRADHETLIDSIKNKILTLPGDTVLLPGHGPETTVKTEADINPHLQQGYQQFGH